MSHTQKASVSYLVALIGFVLLRIMSAFGVFSGMNNVTGELIIDLIIQIICNIFVPFSVFRLLSDKSDYIEDTISGFGYRTIKAKTIFISIIAGAIMFVITVLTSYLWASVLEITGYVGGSNAEKVSPDSTLADFFIALFSTAVLPALGEEFITRGMMLSSLRKEHSITFCVLVTAILFGLFHMYILQSFYAVLCGIFMALAVILSRSIYPAMIMHFMNNAISVIISYSIVFFGNTAQKLQNNMNLVVSDTPFMVTIVMGLFIIGLTYILLTLIVRMAKSENDILKEYKHKNIRYALENLGYYIKLTKNNQPLTETDLIELTEYNTQLALYEKLKGLYYIETTKTNFKDYIALITIITLSGLISIFTYIWGLL